MFDFALSQNQRQRPTRRFVASGIASCLFHVLLLVILLQNPWLLSGGMVHGFRGLTLMPSIFRLHAKDADEDFRTVTILRPMTAPSAATLKKYLYDWNKKDAEKGGPPIRIRWGGELKAGIEDVNPQKPKPVIPPGETTSGLTPTPGAQSPAAAAPAETLSSGIPSPASNEAAKKATVVYPTSGASTKSEAAGNTAPAAIPKPSKPLSAAQTDATVSVFENEQQAIRSQGSGIFDAQGFPIGEYANLIKERVKGKWFIPSNLRNSQGHTTVVFFINKEGRYTDARVVDSSGNYSLNLAALNAIILSDPFPPLPKGFPGDHIGAKFVFSYNEPQ